jgi:hypothetical protein
MCVVLLGAILDNPGLAERLLQVLKPPAATAEASPKALPKLLSKRGRRSQ